MTEEKKEFKTVLWASEERRVATKKYESVIVTRGFTLRTDEEIDSADLEKTYYMKLLDMKSDMDEEEAEIRAKEVN